MMTLTDDTTIREDPFDDASSHVDDPVSGGCPKQSWCTLGAGHQGRCKKYASAADKVSAKNERRRGRSRGRSTSGGSAAPAARSSGGRAPKAEGMRPLLALLWEQAGMLIERNAPEPAGPPVGRMIQFQAPYAANHLHPRLMRLPAYKRLDQVSGGIMDELGPMLLTPILVGVMAMNPDLMGSPALQAMLVGQVGLLAEEAAKEARNTRKAMTDATKSTEEGQAMMNLFLTALFDPPPEPHDDDRTNDVQ